MDSEDKGEPKPGSMESWEKFMGETTNSTTMNVRRALNTMFTGPARWFRETAVEPNKGPEYPYYHRRWRRVPTIDECYMHDYVCMEEANLQYKRDKMVEGAMVQLLGERLTDCVMFYKPILDRDDPNNQCREIKET
jgi:NADH dehydrogenase (ubiquinone) 1 beta subcomplex subunit 10